MKFFNHKPPESCHWDLVSLGEVLLRFDPENERIQTGGLWREKSARLRPKCSRIG